MTRRLLNLLPILSLLLCLAVAALWIRSYLPHERFVFHRGGCLILVFSEGDRSIYLRPRPDDPTRGFDPGDALDMMRAIARTRGTFLGFEFVAGPSAVALSRGNARGEFRVLGVPYFFLLALSGAALGATTAAARRRGRRERLGLCSACGYDLRATPGRCPECGHEPAPAAAERAKV